MMKKKMSCLVGVLAVALLGIAGCGKANEKDSGQTDGKTELTFQIWDANQKAGMESMSTAFMEENPEIKVKVEVTPWDQYWTKLQAAASGGGMADVFWMHPDQVFNFAEGSALLDLTDKIKEDQLEMTKYPEYVVEAFNMDEQQLALPKDYSTLGLWYNKDLFDEKGLAYPDDTWTWETWMTAAETLTDKDKGIYGMLARADAQDFWSNLVWQNGTDIIAKDGKKYLMSEPKAIEAIEFGVSFIDKGFSPTEADFANTKANQYFESGKAAMITAGSWMANEFLSIEGLNVDVAPLPKNEERATVANGMGYAISANSKYPDEAWKFISYLATEEANLLQAKSGAAIPAYEGTQGPWVDSLEEIDAQVFVDAGEYGHSSEFIPSRSNWTSIEQDYMTRIFSQSIEVEEGLKEMTKKIQTEMDDYDK